jgi:hypothetical protein
MILAAFAVTATIVPADRPVAMDVGASCAGCESV